LKYNNVMYASFDSNRDGASLELFNKFIAQPVYDEEQWKTLAKVGGAG
ncbi:phage tail protein, partial [Veillonella dispar]|nr:phage tail protein [Veillonella dispar]